MTVRTSSKQKHSSSLSLSFHYLCSAEISQWHSQQRKTKADELVGLSKTVTIIPEQLSVRLMLMAYMINRWCLGEDGLCVVFSLPVTFLFLIAVTLRV